MKNFDPTKNLKKEFDSNLLYNYWISASIAQGEHDLVSNFLKRVPDSDERGYKIFSIHRLKLIYFS